MKFYEYSEWATPIVVVPKPFKAIRICGDLTVNPQLKINQYPIPRPEELFAALNGGEQITKLHGLIILQLKLDEENQQFMVINTHKGLFKYTGLPFRIAAAPAVFQKTMDIVLQGLLGVVCYLDNIIITGQEHLNNLEQVF